ncbi:MAG TPA: GtrA family protein [Flexivirga sp.]|uniref:GtrA family protein n=1 Tax=Flexivirga sp. TaxID=1962927 RepID=UPI002BEAD0DD|nr:GtrA family protein [Flexivirga sp.]HWC23349.1 GtrA family protein [Flexivirga sp.]
MIGARIVDFVRSLWRELAKFGVIGVINIIIDLGLYNLLIDGPMPTKVTAAKIVSGSVATLFAWVGNRYWTFRHRHNRPVHHEVVLFFGVNGLALAVSVLWVAFAHYVLGLEGKFWLNFNAMFGIGLGTIIRFWAYKQLVFRNEPIADESAGQALAEPLQAQEPHNRESAR